MTSCSGDVTETFTSLVSEYDKVVRYEESALRLSSSLSRHLLRVSKSESSYARSLLQSFRLSEDSLIPQGSSIFGSVGASWITALYFSKTSSHLRSQTASSVARDVCAPLSRIVEDLEVEFRQVVAERNHGLRSGGDKGNEYVTARALESLQALDRRRVGATGTYLRKWLTMMEALPQQEKSQLSGVMEALELASYEDDVRSFVASAKLDSQTQESSGMTRGEKRRSKILKPLLKMMTGGYGSSSVAVSAAATATECANSDHSSSSAPAPAYASAVETVHACAPNGGAVVGLTLEALMQRQKQTYPSLDVPLVFVLLRDSLIRFGAERTVGVFRIPGNLQEVNLYRALLRGEGAQPDQPMRYRLLRGVELSTIAALFKAFIRELPTPVVPSDIYETFVNAEFVASLTRENFEEKVLGAMTQTSNRNVFVFVCGLLSRLAAHSEVTKMTADNLSMLFAPCILRCPFDNPAAMLQCYTVEKTFIRAAIDFCAGLSEKLNTSVSCWPDGRPYDDGGFEIVMEEPLALKYLDELPPSRLAAVVPPGPAGTSSKGSSALELPAKEVDGARDSGCKEPPVTHARSSDDVAGGVRPRSKTCATPKHRHHSGHAERVPTVGLGSPVRILSPPAPTLPPDLNRSSPKDVTPDSSPSRSPRRPHTGHQMIVAVSPGSGYLTPLPAPSRVDAEHQHHHHRRVTELQSRRHHRVSEEEEERQRELRDLVLSTLEEYSQVAAALSSVHSQLDSATDSFAVEQLGALAASFAKKVEAAVVDVLRTRPNSLAVFEASREYTPLPPLGSACADGVAASKEAFKQASVSLGVAHLRLCYVAHCLNRMNSRTKAKAVKVALEDLKASFVSQIQDVMPMLAARSTRAPSVSPMQSPRGANSRPLVDPGSPNPLMSSTPLDGRGSPLGSQRSRTNLADDASDVSGEDGRTEPLSTLMLVTELDPYIGSTTKSRRTATAEVESSLLAIRARLGEVEHCVDAVESKSRAGVAVSSVEVSALMCDTQPLVRTIRELGAFMTSKGVPMPEGAEVTSPLPRKGSGVSASDKIGQFVCMTKYFTARLREELSAIEQHCANPACALDFLQDLTAQLTGVLGLLKARP